MKKTKLSFSSLDTYSQCPYKFVLKHQKYLKPYIPIRYNLVTGVAFHELINSMYHCTDFSRDYLVHNWKKFFNDALESEGSAFSDTQGSDKYLQYGYVLINQFYSFAEQNGYLVKPIESEWEFSIDYLDFRIVGKIDLIIKRDSLNPVEILDFKTGWQVPTVKEVEVNKQLTIYDWAVKTGLKLDNTTVGLFFPRKAQIITTSRTESDHNTILAELADLHNNVLKRQFDPNFNNCVNCEFQNYCEHYRLKQTGY
jgi:CRISPR/Cas system-associated exonuclease Cas4 (RecB family)